MNNYTYEVWALGYTVAGDATDAEIFVEDFETPGPALALVRSINTLEELLAHTGDSGKEIYGYNPDQGDYLELKVEQCIEVEPEDDLDPEEGYTECIDVLYSKQLV